MDGYSVAYDGYSVAYMDYIFSDEFFSWPGNLSGDQSQNGRFNKSIHSLDTLSSGDSASIFADTCLSPSSRTNQNTSEQSDILQRREKLNKEVLVSQKDLIEKKFSQSSNTQPPTPQTYTFIPFKQAEQPRKKRRIDPPSFEVGEIKDLINAKQREIAELELKISHLVKSCKIWISRCENTSSSKAPHIMFIKQKINQFSRELFSDFMLVIPSDDKEVLKNDLERLKPITEKLTERERLLKKMEGDLSSTFYRPVVVNYTRDC